MQKNNPKITILVPCYNKEKYLPRFLKSLKKQKDKNFKVLFLDDKSTDGTLFVLKIFAQENNSLFETEVLSLTKNGGISNARNVLIQETKTEYFFFADPDDFLKPKAIYYFNKKINEADYELIVAKNSLVFLGKFLLPNVISDFFRFERKIKNNSDMALSWVENTSPFSWNKAFKTQWFRNLKLDFVVGRSYEDMLLMNITILEVKKMAYINKVTYRYDVNMDGLTKIHDPKKFSDIFLNLELLYDTLEKNGKMTDWQINSKAEVKVVSKLFIHLFTTKLNVQTIRNFENYRTAFDIMFPFLEKYNIVEKLYKYTSFNRIVLNDALKNYQKIKKLYY